MARRFMLGCGILSSLLYVAMNVYVPMQWPDYSLSSQTVSELSAIGAPTRALWVPLGVSYTALVVVFGGGLRLCGRHRRRLRVAGRLTIAYGLVGLVWPPMHQRQVLAAGGATLTDTLHLAFAMLTVLLMLLVIGLAAGAFGRWFRRYSVATVIVMLAAGAMTAFG